MLGTRSEFDLIQIFEKSVSPFDLKSIELAVQWLPKKFHLLSPRELPQPWLQLCLKDNFKADEEGQMSERRPTMDWEGNIKSGNKLITSKAGLEPTSNLLDLGDAYKLAVSNRGRLLSSILAEHWLRKDSSRVNEDLNILLSQFSATRGTDLSFNDISPRLSINREEAKSSDVSNSTGMQILQKLISLERNESGLSLDESIVSEIEGENLDDKLKRKVDHDRKLISALYTELEEKRNASAIAANQALAMIT